MKPTRIAAGVVAIAVAVASCSDDFPTLSNKSMPWIPYQATLTGAAEVPSVTTTVAGSGNFTMIPTYRDSLGIIKTDTNTVRVQVLISMGATDSVTQAHIHAGTTTVAGPVMVFILSNVAAGRAPMPGTNKVLTQLDITRTSAFSAPYTYDSLKARIMAGTAYANVHTRKNPSGEIRGQIVPKT